MPSRIKSKRYQRKRTNKMVRRTMRTKRPFVQKVHTIKRMGFPIDMKYVGGGFSFTGLANASSFVSGTGLANTYDVGFGLPFALNNAVDSADFSALFDRYRIVGVSLKFMFDINDSNITGAGVLPWITIAQDYDDAAQPTSEQGVLVKQYAKSYRLDKPFTVYVRPKPQLIAGQVAGTTSNAAIPNSKNLYFNCTDTSIVFYGLKGFIRGWYSPLNAQSMLRIQPTYYIALKDTQ